MAADVIAALRAREFARLDRTGEVYLDYTGAALHPEFLPRGHARRLNRRVYGNPHSASPASRRSTRAMEALRVTLLRFLDADPELYDVVLTANASAAAQLVSRSFPFSRGSWLVLTADNHNSVLGARVHAQGRARVRYLAPDAELRIELPSLPPSTAPSLLAYPPQSNFSGVQHPLAWVHHAHAAGYRVLLDAAAYVPSHRLSLRNHPADFVTLSIYKIIGYPTGVGALVVRRDALRMLQRTDFAGGTVEYVSVAHGVHKLRAGPAAHEDGTPNFQAFDAAARGLEWLMSLDMAEVAAHGARMKARLLAALSGTEIHGPKGGEQRGACVAFNIPGMSYEQAERALRRRGIAVRGGCFCNPGAAEAAFGLGDDAVRAVLLRYADRAFTPELLSRELGGRRVGAVRASAGLATNEHDMERLELAVQDLMERARRRPTVVSAS